MTNSTVVHNMTVEVSAGSTLRISTVFSTDIADYKPAVSNEDINAQMKRVHGDEITLEKLRLLPLTSGSGSALYTQSQNTVAVTTGTTPDTGYYMEFTLWFMADSDINVFLNGDNTPEALPAAPDGTKVYSDAGNDTRQKAVERAARLSFDPYHTRTGSLSSQAGDYTLRKTTEPVNIYEPGKVVATKLNGNALNDSKASFGNTQLTQKTFVNLGTNLGTDKDGANPSPFLFALVKDIPTRLVVRLWLEGEDPECVNEEASNGTNIERAKLITRLRFCGADASGNYME